MRPIWFKPHAVPEHSHWAVKRLFEELNEQQMTLKELAVRSGVARSSMQQWKTRCNPTVTGLEAAFGVLGLKFKLVEAE